MRLISLPIGKKITCVATIGVFDGLHQGHSYLLAKLINLAKKRGLPSLVISFWPYPQQVLGKKFLGFITNLDQKKTILKNQGVDYFLVLNTTRKLLNLGGVDFFKKLDNFINIKTLVAGEDFKFGYKASVGINALKALSKMFGFKMLIVKKKKLCGRIASSSLVRKLIREGAFSMAGKILGRGYVLEGRVIKGKGLGKKLGYPSLNLDCDNMVIPQTGVYAVKILLNRHLYLGACNVGFNPTVSESKEKKIEVHVLNYKNNINSRKVSLSFLEKIRDEKKFSSLEKLKAAIGEDTKFILSRNFENK